MTQEIYFEDLFVKLSIFVFNYRSLIDRKDLSAITSFYDLLTEDKSLTKSQADFIVRLLKKYKILARSNGLDYQHELDNAVWKKDFRILDLSKRVFIENDPQKGPIVCLKFPYAFKKIYETDFLVSIRDHRLNFWDHDKKVNRIPASKVNIVSLHEFLKTNNFEIDESFVSLTMAAEEIWQQSDAIAPYAYLDSDRVHLKNASEDAEVYWNEHRIGSKSHDLMLAKSMGFVYRPENVNLSLIETICSADHNDFWCPSFDKFFDIVREIDDTFVVVLDRSDDTLKWLENFVSSADENSVDRSEIKVCFRDDKSEGSVLNKWIKDNHVGGKIDDGRIFVFRHKPAKWLFSEGKSIKIAATNSLFPMSNSLTQHWLDARPCLLYLGNIRPSQIKERKIVEL
jgi:hypothetical protein